MTLMTHSVTGSVETGAYKTEYDKLFIGGEWVEPSTSEIIAVFSPATGERSGKSRWPPRPTWTPPAPPPARPSTKARGQPCRPPSAPR